MDNYNYPIGADNPYAPWNSGSTPEEATNVDVYTSYTLSKPFSIGVNNYDILQDEDVDYDDDGLPSITVNTSVGFNNTNFEEGFNNSGELGIPDLLDILKEIANDNLKVAIKENKKTDILKWRAIKEGCEDWNIDDFVVSKEQTINYIYAYLYNVYNIVTSYC